VCRDDAVGLEAGIHAGEPDEGAEQQAGRDEQDHADADLGGDEQVAQPPRSPAGGRARPVLVIDEKLARRFWGRTSPVGRRMYKQDGPDDLKAPGPKAHWFTVVGVVREIRMAGLVTADDRVGAYYSPLAQNPYRTVTLAVRSGLDPSALVPSIRAAVRSILSCRSSTS
jgi:hypothetical protein